MINRFGKMISERLHELGVTSPSTPVITAICRTVHTASLITEEGRFVQGSITLADPLAPDQPPRLRRADYQAFTSFKKPSAFTPEFFAKLARAVDQWSGSVAVWGTSASKLFAWGIVDQLVGTNIFLNREEESGFANPGILTLIIDRPGDLTAYHGVIFLGSLRAQKIILAESEPFASPMIRHKLSSIFASASAAVSDVIRANVTTEYSAIHVLAHLQREWEATVARICIGLRRIGTGGALIITPNPLFEALSVGQSFNYERLATSLALNVLDKAYLAALEDERFEAKAKTKTVDSSKVRELVFAQADVKDRGDELRGSVKLVTSLAAMDGAVFLTPDLRVIGFGVKISAAREPEAVYDGEDFGERGTKAKRIDPSKFGTRHGSMLRYCKADPEAIGLIISQDGHVRITTTYKGSLVMWDRIQLLKHDNFTQEAVARTVKDRNRIGQRRRSTTLGYSRMPKTLADLLARKINTKGVSSK